MKNPKKIRVWIAAAAVIVSLAIGIFAGYRLSNIASLMPPVEAALSQDTSQYTQEETEVLENSQKFWTSMEQADEEGMRSIADPNCTFVHIGMTCKLDEEIGFYTSGTFQPTEIAFHGQSVEMFGETAVVLTDCDYSLKLGGAETTHHFAVTEIYTLQDEEWRLIQFSFTALVS